MGDINTAVCSVAGGAAGCVSLVLGVDVLVVVAAVAGALVAGSQSGRLDWNFRAVCAGLASFAASVILGVVGGPFFGSLLLGLLLAALRKLGVDHLDAHAADALLALFLSMYGVTVLLPAVAKRLGAEIATRGIEQ